MGPVSTTEELNVQNNPESNGIENLSFDEKSEQIIFDEIENYSEHSTFGQSFSLEDYWKEVKGMNIEFLVESERKSLEENFENLVKSGKLFKNTEGKYSLEEPKLETEFESEPQPEPQPGLQPETQLKDNEEVHEETNTPDTVELKEATDKNGEVIKIGNKVEWDFYGGSGRGVVTSFLSRGTNVLAHVDFDSEKELEINIGNIFLVKESKKVEVPSDSISEVNNEINSTKPEYGEMEDWERLGDLRKQAVREELEQRKSGILGLNLKWQDYENQKQLLEDKIKNTLREKLGENLTAEQENELKKEIQNASYVELIEKEHEARLKDERDIKGETLSGKVLEQAKYLLNTKVIQWYFKQNKWTRLAITTGIATAIGMGVGNVAAGGALTYGGYRLARGAASFGAAGAANKWAQKRWSIDEINEDEKRAIERIKTADQSLLDRSDFYKKVKEEADKERKWATGKKFFTTIGAGAGAGLFSGLTEHIYVDNANVGTGGATKDITEAQPTKSNIPERTPEAVPLETKTEPDTVPVSETLFEDPSVLKHEAVAGDSLWKILKGTLNNNEQFRGMTGAQKTYVISAMTNKALQNPEEYGLGNGGSVYVGDKVDFTKLFENDKEINSIFEKAEQTVAKGSPQESSILKQEAKIAEWVKNNPDAKLTTDKIPEILSTKPKVEEVLPIEKIDNIEVPESTPQVQPEPQLEANNVNEDPTNAGEETETNNAEVLAGGAVLAGVGTASVLTGKALIEKELEEAKKRLLVLEGGRDKNKSENFARNPNLERSLADDLNNAKNGNEIDRAVNAEKVRTVNHFFTEGLIIKKEGIKSKKWKFIKGLSFKKLEKYYKGDSNMSGLTLEETNELNKSNRYKDFFDHVFLLKDYTNGVVILAEGEDPSIELVLEERGRYLLKNPQLANLKKAA